MASKLTEIVNFGSNKCCDIRAHPAEAIVVHEPDDTYATGQPSSKAPSVRGVACPPQWLPVLLTAAPPSLSPPPSPQGSSNGTGLAALTCPKGYYDSTNGNAKFWHCGCSYPSRPYGTRGNCAGGCYTSTGCACACQLDIKPPSQPPVLSPPPPPPLSCSGGWIQPAGPNCAGVDEPEQKKFCNTEIYNNETGYCQCTDQNVTFSCDTTGIGDPRPPFTCTQVCNTASPGLQPCTGTRRDCSRYVCNPNGKYEAYYDIPGRPDQAPKGGLVTKVEVIFDNDRYNNGLAPPEYSGDNRYNKDFVTYSLISTGCTYGDGKFNESVKYNTTTNKPINPPTCTRKRDGESNSNGEPIKKQPVVYGRFDDAPYEFNDVRYGDGNGALFSPVEETPLTVSKIFEFRWCPDQNTFQVMVFKTGPYQFVHVKPEDIVAGKQAEIDQLQADNIQLQANNAQCAADSTGTLILHFP